MLITKALPKRRKFIAKTPQSSKPPCGARESPRQAPNS